MKPSSPLIGVPCYHDRSSGYSQAPVNAQHNAYLSAIGQAGGVPFLIPLGLTKSALRRLFDLADGILLTGGGDIDPSFYHQLPQAELANVQPDRDRMELTLSRWASEEGKAALGICRGLQVMAVALGGSLCQDLPSQKPEATLHNYVYQREGTNAENYLAHQVELKPACHLARVLQTNAIWVNSLHHQAVTEVSGALQVAGYSSDRVVEVIEQPDHAFYWGVQWHPELLVDEHEAARRIFQAFVEASAG
ncbi:MAG: gamma-glutamyl-gamma-aminobutyrate hydrolase family protein [Anaerolineae bacterium]|nr:gamma-glutamyl-gamma-aminobutyrate hydrolase family protein [Anaerolineae bacterium]